MKWSLAAKSKERELGFLSRLSDVRVERQSIWYIQEVFLDLVLSFGLQAIEMLLAYSPRKIRYPF